MVLILWFCFNILKIFNVCIAFHYVYELSSCLRLGVSFIEWGTSHSSKFVSCYENGHKDIRDRRKLVNSRTKISLPYLQRSRWDTKFVPRLRTMWGPVEKHRILVIHLLENGVIIHPGEIRAPAPHLDRPIVVSSVSTVYVNFRVFRPQEFQYYL